jgi:hypothetical protein
MQKSQLTQLKRNKMKKIITLIAAIILVSGLAWYAYDLYKHKDRSDTELIDFAIKDINSIDRIIIKDKQGYEFELEKKAGTWTSPQSDCVPTENVEFILEAFKNIEFKGYLPKNSMDHHLKVMASQHISVKIYQNGDWVKTWYLGSSTPDHYGQIMLLDSDEFGKSDYPVIMKIKNLSGMIEPRFYGDARKWACTEIFELEMDQIQEVDVSYNDVKDRSFKVKKGNEGYNVFQQEKLLAGVDQKMVFKYLNQFKNIHYNIANYELNKEQIDSLKKTTPFVQLKLTQTDKTVTKLRMFRIKASAPQENEFGETTDKDVNNFWCELNNGEIVKCQYYALSPILYGHVYFPLVINKENLPQLSQDIE